MDRHPVGATSRYLEPEAREIYIFSAVLLVQSLPFIAALVTLDVQALGSWAGARDRQGEQRERDVELGVADGREVGTHGLHELLELSVE